MGGGGGRYYVSSKGNALDACVVPPCIWVGKTRTDRETGGGQLGLENM